MTTLADEMPDNWVRSLADRIEAQGHEIVDAHESAIVISLGPDARTILGADPGDVLVIGWSEAGGLDWGVSADGAHVPTPRSLGGATPPEIAARTHHLLTTGRPEPRAVRHAIPYAAPSGNCRCEQVRPCGGIIPNADCPDHGDRRTPAMEWHWENACGQAAG